MSTQPTIHPHPTLASPSVRGHRSLQKEKVQQCEWKLAAAPRREASGNPAWSVGEMKPVPGLPSITATLYYQSVDRLSPFPEVSRTRVDMSRREPVSREVGEGSQSSSRPREGLRRDPVPSLPSDFGHPMWQKLFLAPLVAKIPAFVSVLRAEPKLGKHSTELYT